jgi:hypothetical protein
MDFWLTVTGMWYSVLNISSASPLLAQLFGIYGLVVGSALILKKETPKREAIKLLGSTFVLALAFAANASWTYALAIFVVATLVTELEFLEKLAAMFTNNGQHLATLVGRDRDGIGSAASRAAAEAERDVANSAAPDVSSLDVESAPAALAEPQQSTTAGEAGKGNDATRVGEADAEGPVVKTPSIPEDPASARDKKLKSNRYAHEVSLKKYYASVGKALVAEKGPFPGGRITSDLVFSVNGEKHYADFVVVFFGKVYVINARQRVTPVTLRHLVAQTTQAAQLYSRIESVEAQPTLVLPSRMRGFVNYGLLVEILFYDESQEMILSSDI